MPITAKLSRKFYDRFGDDIASELVDWFNAVDLTYQTQLREMNDLNWERFRATLSAESASIRGEVDRGLASLRTEMHGMKAEVHAIKAEIIKWTFVFWIGAVATLGGLVLTH